MKDRQIRKSTGSVGTFERMSLLALRAELLKRGLDTDTKGHDNL